MKKITLPVTATGNDPADYDQQTLDDLNSQIDTEQSLARAGDLSVHDAQAYIALYETLKARAALRGKDEIDCPVTNGRYQDCLAVLKGAQ